MTTCHNAVKEIHILACGAGAGWSSPKLTGLLVSSAFVLPPVCRSKALVAASMACSTSRCWLSARCCGSNQGNQDFSAVDTDILCLCSVCTTMPNAGIWRRLLRKSTDIAVISKKLRWHRAALVRKLRLDHPSWAGPNMDESQGNRSFDHIHNNCFHRFATLPEPGSLPRVESVRKFIRLCLSVADIA